MAEGKRPPLFLFPSSKPSTLCCGAPSTRSGGRERGSRGKGKERKGMQNFGMFDLSPPLYPHPSARWPATESIKERDIIQTFASHGISSSLDVLLSIAPSEMQHRNRDETIGWRKEGKKRRESAVRWTPLHLPHSNTPSWHQQGAEKKKEGKRKKKEGTGTADRNIPLASFREACLKRLPREEKRRAIMPRSPIAPPLGGRKEKEREGEK